MTALPELLREFADEARPYADPDRVVAAARRRRTAGLAVATACVATAAAIGAGVALLPGPGGPRTLTPGPTVGSTDVPAEVRAVYPPSIAAQPLSPRIPATAGVGPASVIVAPCARITTDDCWPNVVLPDGRQFALPPTVDRGLPRDLSLSPDGRYAGWGYTSDGFFHLRDLTTGATRRFGEQPNEHPTSAWAWSPDGRWLLLAEHLQGTVLRYFLADMDGGVRELPAAIDGPDNSVVGLLNGGDLLVWQGSTYDGLPTLGTVDPVTGQEKRRVTASLPPNAGQLPAAGERVVWYLVSPCSCEVLLFVYGGGSWAWPDALLAMDLGDGHITGRLDLPDPGPTGAVDSDSWSVPAYLRGGIVLVHSHPTGTYIEVMNSVTGERAVAARLPADSYVVVRSQVRCVSTRCA